MHIQDPTRPVGSYIWKGNVGLIYFGFQVGISCSTQGTTDRISCSIQGTTDREPVAIDLNGAHKLPKISRLM